MVARRSHTNPARESRPAIVLAELFEMWRHLVTWVRDAALAALSRLTPTPAEKTVPPVHWLLRRRLVWLGASALVIGAGAGVAVSGPGMARSLAIWAGAQSALWAIVRWLLVRYAHQGRGVNRTALLGAMSFGLLAYGVALTPELRAVAWAGSAALTWLALVLLDGDRRAASRSVGVAWGAHALVVAGSWIMRGGVLSLLLARG